jgi:hypothetical protein
MTDKQIKLFNRLLKEVGIFKMYCFEKRINTCKRKIKDLSMGYPPSYIPNYVLIWNQTQYPTFWMHLASSLIGISWQHMEDDMDDCVKLVKNYKYLVDFHFW